MKKLLVILFIISFSISAFIVVKNISPKTATVPAQEEVLKEPSTSEGEDVSANQMVVEKFLQNIIEKKIPEAISMMTAGAVPNEETKQAWGVHFAAFTKLVITSIEPVSQESWTSTKEIYKVTMDVEMSKESANSLVPYFGYVPGTNIRWISIEKEGIDWKIADLSTGP